MFLQGLPQNVFYMGVPSETFKNALEVIKRQSLTSDTCVQFLSTSVGNFNAGIDHSVGNVYLGVLRKMSSSE